MTREFKGVLWRYSVQRIAPASVKASCMAFVRFQEMLRENRPAFRCYAAGDRAEALAFTAFVRHVLNPPATAAALAEFDSQFGGACQSLRELLSSHDGMVLFCDTRSDAVGLELFPIADWPARTAEMRESMEAMGFDLADMPQWFDSGIVVGQIPQSANYFVVGTTGESTGKLYYADHDDFAEDPIADDAESLVSSLIADPAQFMYDRGCYTRYSDGTTETQWIPKQYLNATSS